jgi:hypothetical protein
MARFGHLHSAVLLTLSTLAAVAAAYSMSGGEMFSPGSLSAENRSGDKLGGVASHAELANRCAACHAPPWSRELLATRCLDCHTDVRGQIDSGGPLHGNLADSMACRDCHTEHVGPHAPLTDLASFDHSWTGFPLTGRHTQVACNSCHSGEVYKGTPHDCASCHAEPQVHQGRFGTGCAQCHSTSAWEDAVFEHRFPLTHGGGGKKQKACITCHTTAGDYRTYTCYQCHRHDPHKTQQKHLRRGIADVQDCASCHPTGRKRKPESPRPAKG